jgi:hypothetical protein
VGDGAFEGLKKRARDIGLIVNAGRKTGSTRKPDPKAGRAAEEKTGGKKKRGKQ